MRKALIAATALMTALGPILTPAAMAHDRHGRGDHHGGYGGYDERYDGYHDRRDRREHRRERRREWRAEHWEGARHNGYTYNGRWYYGAPPPAYYQSPAYHPGYRAWRRGDVYPGYFRSRAVVVDHHRHPYLYAPPRGYHWVHDRDRGEYLLIGIATGVILGAILSQY